MPGLIFIAMAVFYYVMLAANFAWICTETDAQIEQNMNMKHQFGSILQTAALAQARTERDTAES